MIHQIIEEDIQSIIGSIKKELTLLEGKTVLVTGSAGFLGNYFIAVLHELNKSVLKKPCRVIAIDNYITGSRKNIAGNLKSKYITFIKGDASQPISVNGSIDYILHAAGIAPLHII